MRRNPRGRATEEEGHDAIPNAADLTGDGHHAVRRAAASKPAPHASTPSGEGTRGKSRGREVLATG